MEVEFTFDGYAVTVWVGNYGDDYEDEDEIIDIAKDIMRDKNFPMTYADNARVL